jgi:hypothetical protein
MADQIGRARRPARPLLVLVGGDQARLRLQPGGVGGVLGTPKPLDQRERAGKLAGAVDQDQGCASSVPLPWASTLLKNSGANQKTRRENESVFPLPPARAARGGEGLGVGGTLPLSERELDLARHPGSQRLRAL